MFDQWGGITILTEQGIHTMIAGGMGMRPLVGFNQMGIKVYFGDENQTVGDAVMLFLQEASPNLVS